MINGIRTDDEASTAANEETSIKTVEKEPAVVFAPVEEQPKVQIKFGQDVAFENGVEVKHTAVEVELPFAEQPSPDEAQGLIEEARAMAEAAREADDASGLSNNSKRKVDEITTGDEDSEDNADREGSEVQGPRSKKAKTEKTEVQLRKERVRNRALVGLSATLAVG